jgi:predicted nucleic acid-binding protein
MNVIDTNVWIYSHDSQDPVKQAAVLNLISTVQDLVLPWQVGCEFMAASRKLIPQGFDESKAWAAMQAMSAEVVLPVPALWSETRVLQQRYSLSFWDALLASTCIRRGVQNLYTEDMGAPRRIDTLSLINIFAGP